MPIPNISVGGGFPSRKPESRRKNLCPPYQGTAMLGNTDFTTVFTNCTRKPRCHGGYGKFRRNSSPKRIDIRHILYYTDSKGISYTIIFLQGASVCLKERLIKQ